MSDATLSIEVPDLRATRPADPDDERAIDAMTADAARIGWREAVKRHRPELLAYVDEPGRSAFLDLLPLTPATRALEIGPGLGQILVPLSERVAFAHALELSPAQARFTAQRCREEGRTNVAVAAGGDDLTLPYADTSFDVAVLSHVLEWVRGAGDRDANEAAQRQLLAELYRVLEPGGTLYVGTKNRFSLRLLLGGCDENARDLRFGHALPRRLGQTLAASRAGTSGHLHSYSGLRALLSESGFDLVHSYWSGPDNRYPRWHLANDARSIRAARATHGFEQGATRTTQAVMPWVPAALVHLVSPGLTFVVRRRPA